jgi:hypothetical protein
VMDVNQPAGHAQFPATAQHHLSRNFSDVAHSRAVPAQLTFINLKLLANPSIPSRKRSLPDPANVIVTPALS